MHVLHRGGSNGRPIRVPLISKNDVENKEWIIRDAFSLRIRKGPSSYRVPTSRFGARDRELFDVCTAPSKRLVKMARR